jgi:hypothetical protein
VKDIAATGGILEKLDAEDHENGDEHSNPNGD